MIIEALPGNVPAGEHITAQAVRSVHARGFYDSTPPAAKADHIMAQVLRLAEEIGEVSDARRKRLTKDEQATEIADVYIVVCQLVWLTGMSPSMQLGRLAMPGTNMSIELGELTRALRKWSGAIADAAAVHYALMRFAGLCYTMSDQCGVKLEERVAEKLGADGRRGYQHEGVTQ